MRRRLEIFVGCSLAVLLLGVGCGERTPRELSSPVFDPRSPFPELAGAQRKGTASGERTSAFQRALVGAAAPGQASAQQEPRGQTVPLGNGLLGELPPGSWTWSADPSLTLAVHRGAAGVDALIWAEGFSSRMMFSPSSEIRRFHRTVVPEETEDLLDFATIESLFGHGLGRRIARGTGLDASQSGRFLQLAMTRTAGLGLGFRSAREGSTGSRWGGRNPRGVTIFLARSSGTWGRQRRFPADLARALGRLEKAAPELSPVAVWLSRAGNAEGLGAPPGGGPAYLLIGSAAAENDAIGAHLAVVCAREPDCLVAAELATFLGSLQIADLPRLQRLQGSSAGDPADLARSAGLQILPMGVLPNPEILEIAGPPAAETPR